jgi:dTDP-4-dehydrorhamnose reductase
LKILLTGRNGQVGWELERTLVPFGELIGTDRTTLDLADPDAIRRVVREAKPEVIVNAAAYTAVDKAESEPGLAMRINGFAPGVLAEEAKRLGALLVHYTTDYVFDGKKATPYGEDDAPNPLNAYGKSKLAGERAVIDVGARHLILRTSWVYSTRGTNFLLTILRLAKQRPALTVVDDQRGTPTWARSIAHATLTVLARPSRRSAEGMFNLTAAGETTWFGFAGEILRLAQLSTRVEPIASEQYPTAARRPKQSALDCSKFRRTFGVRLPIWSEDLAKVMETVRPL